MVSDIALIRAAAQIEQLTTPVNPEALGIDYDVAVAYGDIEGWTRSPITPHVALVMTPNITPLDDPFLLGILRQSINPNAIVETLEIPGAVADELPSTSPTNLRTELANAGRPDGLSISLAYTSIPGVSEIAMQLQTAGIQGQMVMIPENEIAAAFDEGRIQAALLTWESSEERAGWVDRFGDANVLDLYTLPISYIATSGLNIRFTPGGWPLPST